MRRFSIHAVVVAAAAALLAVTLSMGRAQTPQPNASQPAASQPATQPVASRPVYGPDSPAQRLSTQGKSDRWIEATDRCRALLDRLDPADAKVKAYLPNLQRQCEMIRRVDGFSWKTVTAVEFLANALEDLLAGKTPNRRYAGRQLGFPYWSERMRRIEATWVHVPAAYDPDKPHQLFLYYKSGGGIHYDKGKAAGGHRPTVEMANKTDTFHAWSSLNIQVKGRLGLEIELEEFPAALAKEFSVDTHRVFLTGYSDGGFSALWLATHYPHLVAGIAPNCANWQYTNVEYPNLRNVPYLVVDGWGDGGYVEDNFLRFAALSNMGGDAACLFGQHGHSYAPFEDEQTLTQIAGWAKTKRLDPWPRHIRYATWNLAWNRAYWVSIERTLQPWLTSQVEAGVHDDNRIEIRTRNVAALKVSLGENLVDRAKPVTLTIDGKEAYSGPYKEQVTVELSPRPAGRFVKDAAMPDEITAQVVASTYSGEPTPDRRWLAVKGTAAAEKTGQLLEKWFPKDAKADNEVTEDDIARCNLVLYGGPQINRLTARIAADLPVTFDKGRFTIGRTTYGEPTNGVAFLHPNPLNPRRYVIVLAFNDAEVFAANKYFDLAGEIGAWKFRTGDCVVAGIPATKGGKAGFRQRHIIFDATWRADAPVVAHLPEPLDRSAILRLRAAAIREATGADVGIIWRDAPDYQRWTESLPAGPVTIADLATLDMLPEYVMTGRMLGSQLARLQAAASTIAADASAPDYRQGASLLADSIEPERAYRVAMGFWGVPSYRAEAKRMPKLFRFASVEEFLAGEGTDVHVEDLRITRIEVAEALAEYMRKQSTSDCSADR